MKIFDLLRQNFLIVRSDHLRSMKRRGDLSEAPNSGYRLVPLASSAV